MKRVLNTLLLLIGLSVLSVSVIYFIYPGVLLKAVQSMSAKSAELDYRSVDLESYKAHYYEGGSNNQTTLVLLHGLGDDKNSFVTAVRELTQNYRVILPDLQAHGDNAQVEGRDYSIAGQARFIEELLQKLNANRVFIGGNSMGGHIALSFAARSSEKTVGLILLNSAGLQTTQDTIYKPYPDSVDSAFFNDMFARLFVTPPAFPKPVMQHMANELNPKIPFFNSVIRQIKSGDYLRMNEQSKQISVNSLIIWGKQDPLLAVEVAERLNKNLANSELILLENVGHSPQIEVPELVQSELKSYLASQSR
jgi:pimeloyl-ACP methyl ester carboxylesterase